MVTAHDSASSSSSSNASDFEVEDKRTVKEYDTHPDEMKITMKDSMICSLKKSSLCNLSGWV